MHTNGPAKAFDSVIQSLEGRLDAAKQLKRLLETHPDLADELERYFTRRRGAAKSARTNGDGNGQTYADRIVKFFRDHNNRWTTTPDIVKEIGIPRGGLSYVLYKTHSDRFESKKYPGHGRMRQWRLLETEVAQ